MTTVRAASSATLSEASVPRRVAVLRRAARREVVAQEEVLREAVQEAPLRENRTVVAVVPAVMTMAITTRLAAVAEAEGDEFFVTKPTKPSKLKSWELATAPNRDAVATPD